MFDFFNLPYIQTVILGASLLGILAGLMGSFSYVRGENLVGDAISHAALPGIAIAFILHPSRNILFLLSGAALSGLCAMALIIAIRQFSKIKTDTALALILSVFFGTGMILMGVIQRYFGAEQAGLDSFIFGQAAAFMKSDLYIIIVALMIVLFVLIRYFHLFKLLSFDPDFFQSLGLEKKKYSFILNALLIMVVILGLQTVGVVLMSALLIGPPSIARLWTEKFASMVFISAVIGGLCGLVGTIISIQFDLPTGPAIVICLMVLVLVNFLFAPGRGIIARNKEQKKVAAMVRNQSVLMHIIELANPQGWTSLESLKMHKKFQEWKPGYLESSIEVLEKEGRILRLENKLQYKKEANL